MTEYFPGTDIRVPKVMTELEAARYTRVAEGATSDTAIKKRMDRLVVKGLIKPFLVAAKRRYTRDECDRFMAAQAALANS